MLLLGAFKVFYNGFKAICEASSFGYPNIPELMAGNDILLMLF